MALRTYVDREGHARVHHKHREGEFNLGRWVDTQRTVWRRGKLDPERVALLEALPGWSWEPGKQ